MTISRFEIGTNYRNERRLHLYFDRILTDVTANRHTNNAYNAIISKIGVSLYNYIYPNNDMEKLQGIDLLLIDNDHIAIDPSTRSGFTLSSLGKWLLERELITLECSQSINKYYEIRKNASVLVQAMRTNTSIFSTLFPEINAKIAAETRNTNLLNEEEGMKIAYPKFV